MQLSKTLIIGLVLGALPFSLVGQDGALGMPNGRIWKTLSRDERVCMASGYWQGMSYAFASTAKKADDPAPGEAMRQIYPTSAKVGEVVEFLDRFYVIPENAPLIVGDGIRIFAMKAVGRSQADIDIELAAMRKTTR